jgi:hypothetical protein
VTLPEDVLQGLGRLHPDLGWAIVSLFQKKPASPYAKPHPKPPAELANVGAGRALIIVNPKVLRRVDGVSLVSLANGPAFMAFEPGRGLADLELAVGDRLARKKLGLRERRELEWLQTNLRRWRRNPQLNVRTQSIIVIERRARPAS